jgi:hypothetical protein
VLLCHDSLVSYRSNVDLTMVERVFQDPPQSHSANCTTNIEQDPPSATTPGDQR